MPVPETIILFLLLFQWQAVFLHIMTNSEHTSQVRHITIHTVLLTNVLQDRQFFFYSDTKAPKFDPNEGPAAKFPVAFLYKFYDKVAIKTNGTSSLNWTFYRYADVLLMLTEVNWALNQLGTAVAEADIIKGINAVRTRALLPTYTGADITLKNIMAERAYELIFENKMLWDMRRTRKALKDGSGQFISIENLVGHQPTTFNYQFSAKHLLSPVSSTEIDNNKYACRILVGRLNK